MSAVIFLAIEDDNAAEEFLRQVQDNKLVASPVVQIGGKRTWRPTKVLAVYRSGIEEHRG